MTLCSTGRKDTDILQFKVKKSFNVNRMLPIPWGTYVLPLCGVTVMHFVHLPSHKPLSGNFAAVNKYSVSFIKQKTNKKTFDFESSQQLHFLVAAQLYVNKIWSRCGMGLPRQW